MPQNVTLDSFEWPISLWKMFFNSGLFRHLSSVCPSTETPSSLNLSVLLIYHHLFQCYFVVDQIFDFDSVVCTISFKRIANGLTYDSVRVNFIFSQTTDFIFPFFKCGCCFWLRIFSSENWEFWKIERLILSHWLWFWFVWCAPLSFRQYIYKIWLKII